MKTGMEKLGIVGLILLWALFQQRVQSILLVLGDDEPLLTRPPFFSFRFPFLWHFIQVSHSRFGWVPRRGLNPQGRIGHVVANHGRVPIPPIGHMHQVWGR